MNVVLESGAHSLSLCRPVLRFLAFKVDLKHLVLSWILEELYSKYIAMAHVQKISFLCIPRWVSFKRSRAKSLEEICT